MHRPQHIPSVISALTVLLAGAACGDGLSTEAPGALEHLSMIAAHAPSQLKSPNPAVASTPPGYTQLDGASAVETGGALSLSVDVQAAIPRFPDSYIQSVAVFGYAWLDANLSGLVAVIHPAIGRDSRQNPDAWHLHPVQLTTGTASSDLCVAGLGTAEGGISIHDDELRVHASEGQAGFAASEVSLAAAFIVQVDADCGSSLGVRVLSTSGV
jgi:hypothetical protein